MTRILITGGSGFLGRPLLGLLSQDQYEIFSIGRSKIDIPRGFGKFFHHQGDFSDLDCLVEPIRKFAPEIFIHLAWQGIPDFSATQCSSNLKMSIDLADAVIAAGACKKILVSGSCFEYNQMFGPCLESNRGTIKDSFTWAKHSLLAWLEMVCAQRGISLGWLRAFYIYGPGQRVGSLVPSIFNALKTGTLPPLRTPNNSNDFIHVQDVARGFVQAVKREFPSGIYNFGSGFSTPVARVCEIAETLVTGSRKLTDELVSVTQGNQKTCDFWANCEGAEEILGWKPEITLEDGMRGYLEAIS
jgi:nucleoside-diphosphate-sugar epimerase